MDNPNTTQRQIDDANNSRDNLALEAVQNMCAFGMLQFKALDKNNDGYLTKIELEDAGKSGGFSGQDQKNLQAMLKTADEVQTAIHHGWKFRNDTNGIAYRDLQEVQSWAKYLYPKLEEVRAVRECVGRNFSVIDKDGSKTISEEELRDATAEVARFNRYDRLNFQAALNSFQFYGSKPGSLQSRVISMKDLDDRVNYYDRSSTQIGRKIIWNVAKALDK
ncbi:MAG: hypothetical protein K2W95_29220 [Candidatus Obscuribacterales bacterium]|nr:hypothetical protein [Candidatus Obscuribacterales bacterium]